MLEKIDANAGLPRSVSRNNVYSDVVDMFRDNAVDILKEYPLRIRYDGEQAIDTGGVCRDMFSAFWSDVYLRHCDGERLFILANNPNTDCKNLPLLGTILSHGFLVCGVLPTKIAFPVIATVLLGPAVEVPDNIVLESFFDFLSSYESSIIRDAISKAQQSFTCGLQEQLINVLSRLGCVEVPTPANIKQLVTSVAKHLLIGKCLGQLYTMSSGVPIAHIEFWKEITAVKLFDLYKALNATPEKVLAIIEEPEDMNMAQTKAFSFLTTFLANASPDTLRLLLRFITGSSVMIDFPIKVLFNTITGLGRRVIAHTCDCTIELPSSYETYPEFQQELLMLLSSDFAWTMDAL